MSNSLSKLLRKLRIDQDELLKNMADKLGMSSSMLSAIENGNRKPPKGFLRNISSAYALSPQEEEEIELAIASLPSSNGINIGMSSLSESDQRLAFSFARRFADFSDSQKDELKRIINKGGE